jgi:hypothetical protein
MSSAKAGNHALCTTTQVEIRPLPLAFFHSRLPEKQCGQTGPGGRCGLPHSLQNGSINS